MGSQSVEEPVQPIIEQYARVARNLGQFNGAYLAGHPLPNHDWIAHDWLRKFVNHAAPMIDFIRQNPAHQSVEFILPGMSLLTKLSLWDQHPHMLDALDDLPQTFCHQDAFGRNLFFRNGMVIAIDWGFAGIAPVGAELAALVGIASPYTEFPSNQIKELDQTCFSNYLEGLHQAGCKPDPRQVRIGYTLTMMLRNVLGGVIGEVLPVLVNEKNRRKATEALGKRPEKAGTIDEGLVAYYQDIGIEAMKLLGLESLIRFIGQTGVIAISLARKRQNL